eukprot:CAMPEP_0119526782 /NCGR_PEP_ID=MMETSP1344-20130328/41331_1 /TAXON_ID=236787 /ORGANISM="Florenciella parvula, Strain CCMP2471" /LENGTH=33 /DNA_ID= /DNA_START= /DNA_END= /DNA_ORIENTATION=
MKRRANSDKYWNFGTIGTSRPSRHSNGYGSASA